MSRRRQKKHEHANHERWLVSYADFITLLFAFFVVMFAVSQVDSKKVGRFVESVNAAFQIRGVFPANSGTPMAGGGGASANALVPPVVADRPTLFRYTAASPRARAVKESIEAGIEAGSLGNRVGLRYDPRGVAVSLPEEVFFRAGTATLRAEALEALGEVGALVRDQAGPVLVEAHTDDVPVRSPVFASNWELSAARAARIARFLADEASVEPERLAAVGLADVRPLAVNADEASRASNRRVDLVLVTEGLDETR